MNVPTAKEIDLAIAGLTPDEDNKLAEALASSQSFLIFTGELSKQMQAEADAGRMTAEQVYLTMMQAYIRLGIHIGVEMERAATRGLEE